MKWLLLNVMLCVAICGVSSDLWGFDNNAKTQLALATTETVSELPVDTNLLAEICALQLRIADTEGAKATLRQIMAHSREGGGYGGPLAKLAGLINKQSDPEQFDSLISFFKIQGVGVEPGGSATTQIDLMIVNMIAHAASKKKYEIARSLLSRLSEPPDRFDGFSSEHPTIKAVLWINIPLVQEDKNIAEALRNASLFQAELARALVCKDIYQLAMYEPEVEKQIDEFLDGVGNAAEIEWCRARLNVALGNRSALWDKDRDKRADGSKAAKMLRRMSELGMQEKAHLYPLVARLLRKEGKTDEALEFLIRGEKSDVQKGDNKPDFTTRMLARQFGEAGEIDKAIELSAHWSRNDVKFRSNRLQTYQSQPLFHVAKELAKAGRLEDATRVAMSIQDNYWRTDTINEIGERYTNKDKELWLEYVQRATEEAAKIEPLEDRQRVLRNIIGRQVEYLDFTFDELLEMIEPLSDHGKSSVLGSKMEYLLDESMPLDQVRKAISIIEKGDTMDLEITASKLLERGEEDLAVETILKIKLTYDFEFYLHNFFETVRKNWSLDKKLDFISRSQMSEQPELIHVVFKEASKEERAEIAPIALDILSKSELGLTFHLGLMKTLFDDYSVNQRFELLEKLMDIPLEEEFQIQEMTNEIDKATTKLVESGNGELLQMFESALKPAWCRAAVERAKVKADISIGDFPSAIRKIGAFTHAKERARLRCLLAEKLIGANLN